ncbi:MAG: gamma-glutamyl-gamma-aminobutyrate hydrolase family protein [Actinomycetota bacterium]|nr:gamma-glutamyl-gamma-aminobutyrate hydrolase family protein [Actinomycetota bacterium]
MSRRPLIGISTSEVRGPDEFKPKPQGDPPRKDLALGYRYFEAIERAGGVPVILPPLAEVAVEPLLARLDGLCLAGGPDIDPGSYGGSRHPALGPTEPEIDRFEMRITSAALDRRMPIFAICRGLQIVNVVLGGSLRMHLPEERADLLVHRRIGDEGPVATHEVRVDEESVLGRVYGSEPLIVNSYHHQAIRELGRGLRAVAHSGDGVIEGAEMRGPGFVVGVQWHAECMAGPRHDGLYEAFVDASRAASGTARERLAA